MLGLLITIALVGLFVWILLTYVPMPKPFRALIIVVAAIILILLVIRSLGLDGEMRLPS